MLINNSPVLQFLPNHVLRLDFEGICYLIPWRYIPPVIEIDMGKGQPKYILQPMCSSSDPAVKDVKPARVIIAKRNGIKQNDDKGPKITQFFTASVNPPDPAPLPINNVTTKSNPVRSSASAVKTATPITNYGRPHKKVNSAVLKTSPMLVNGSIQNVRTYVKGASAFPSPIDSKPIASSPSTPYDKPKKEIKKTRGRRKRVKLNSTPNGIKITKSPMTINRQLTEYYPVRKSCRQTTSRLMKEKQSKFEEMLLSGKEEGLKAVEINGKGRGVVTTRIFKKGEFVVEYSGELIDFVEAKQREVLYAQDQNTGCYMYYFIHNNRRYCVDATAESGRLGRLVNHSRNGNLVTKSFHIDDVPHLILVAKHDIPPGEELLYDYGDRSKESLESHPWLAM